MENNIQLDGLKKSDIIGYDKVLESLPYPYEISLACGSQTRENSFDIRSKRDILNAHVKFINKSSVVREKATMSSFGMFTFFFFSRPVQQYFVQKRGFD